MNKDINIEVKINGRIFNVPKHKYNKNDIIPEMLKNGSIQRYSSGYRASVRNFLGFIETNDPKKFEEIFQSFFISNNKKEVTDVLFSIYNFYRNINNFEYNSREGYIKRYQIYTKDGNLQTNYSNELKENPEDILLVFYNALLGIKNKHLIEKFSIDDVLKAYCNINNKKLIDLNSYYQSIPKGIKEQNIEPLVCSFSNAIDEKLNGVAKDTKCFNCKYSIWENCPKTQGINVEVKKLEDSNEIALVSANELGQNNFDDFPYVTTSTKLNDKNGEFKYSKENIDKIVKNIDYEKSSTIGTYNFKKRLSDYKFIDSGMAEYDDHFGCIRYSVMRCKNYIPSPEIALRNESKIRRRIV
jgi:hypothetical protein